jgi:hypothetical protein
MSVWNGKQIDSLSLKELEQAVGTVRSTAEKYNAKRAEMEKMKDNKDHRFNKMFVTELPPVNPLFTQLQNDLEAELKRRTGVK